jgi:NADPH2 dehydrogenase
METRGIVRIGSIKDVGRFKQHLASLRLAIPCDEEIIHGLDSPLRHPIKANGIEIGNRIVVQPMEGWDGTSDGNPTENTIRRWRRFGRSGAKLIWGGEAVAVSHDGRANPNQLMIAPHTEKPLAKLRQILTDEHRQVTGSKDGLLVGLQLTHSGRYSRPNRHDRPEPRIAYHHPILDRRLAVSSIPVLSDAELDEIVEKFHAAASIVQKLGFDFVDVKHCHGYLGHELLGGKYEGRTIWRKF